MSSMQKQHASTQEQQAASACEISMHPEQVRTASHKMVQLSEASNGVELHLIQQQAASELLWFDGVACCRNLWLFSCSRMP